MNKGTKKMYYVHVLAFHITKDVGKAKILSVKDLTFYTKLAITVRKELYSYTCIFSAH